MHNIFAFWMADVHSVGGYVFANLLGRPGQQAGVPYALSTRLSFGECAAGQEPIGLLILIFLWVRR
ncbi:hypothetical protein BW247_00130 [Acidihalobacter ferrooxydans]|uniref:Uncharacterized protein n=1 Tax=Acidihalobacter ferrooxydans TaxID=1765967 RepID=A0A1P8UD47_9GAMM|nr:hypothetical protein BW247_00130 [Acidihalobacter ferrooxydans]